MKQCMFIEVILTHAGTLYAGAVVHTIACQEVPQALAWNPYNPVLAWCGHFDPVRKDWYSATVWAPP